ncbi:MULTISPECIES: hypothetical protein [unclassified Acinetobacter]|uniref:hypothetical protein n=1 Tax=unclassified Acinetobacter TaxID=196816 RepID=UPI0035B9190E
MPFINFFCYSAIATASFAAPTTPATPAKPTAPATVKAPVAKPAAPAKVATGFKCKDGSTSTAKTKRGACSGHGGVA